MFRPSHMHVRELFPRICRMLVGLTVACLSSLSIASAQTTYFWRAEATNGDWNNSGNWWNGSSNATPGGNEILRFQNGVQTSMSNNLSNTSRFRIFFDSSAGSRTISGTALNTFYDFGGNMPKIENLASGTTQTLNFPIRIGYVNGLEINPVQGSISIGGTIDTNGNYLKIYGANGHTLSLQGVVSGSGGIDVNQNSIVQLSADNTYTGSTTVSAGTLIVNGNQASATGNVWIAAGTTLAGTGRIGGATTISGTHAPGTAGSIGTQTFSSTLTYASGSIFSWDLNVTAPSSINSTTTYDKVAGTASGSSSAFSILLGNSNFTDAFWDVSHTWADIFTSGNLASVFNSFSGTDVGSNGQVAGQGQFSFSGTTLQWNAIPEPSAVVAGLLIGSAMLRRSRERKPVNRG